MDDRWDRIFLRQALGWACASKDPDTQVGAVIVGPDRKARATGFNGRPGQHARGSGISALQDGETEFRSRVGVLQRID